MEIVISVFIGVWICAAAILAYLQFRKEFNDSEGKKK